MFRIVCDPSSGIKELYLTKIRSRLTVIMHSENLKLTPSFICSNNIVNVICFNNT